MHFCLQQRGRGAGGHGPGPLRNMNASWADELDVNRAFTTASTESEKRNILSIIHVIERKENPFVVPPKEKRLHNIQTNEVMTEDISSQLLNVEGIGLTAYEKFRNERFCTKTVRLSDTIHRTNLKTFASVHKPSDSKKVSKKHQSAKMPSCNECLILLRREESPWKTYFTLMYVQVHLCLMKKAS